ncbi:MAG: addiction module protein [bacterium]
MNKTLLEKVLDLPPIERVEFAQLILASLEVEDKSVRNAWIKEVERRINDYKSGKSKLLDFEEVFK